MVETSLSLSLENMRWSQQFPPQPIQFDVVRFAIGVPSLRRGMMRRHCRPSGHRPRALIGGRVSISHGHRLKALILTLAHLLDNNPVPPLWRNIKFLSRYLYGFVCIGSLNRA
jgi:hypothetical protein